MTMPTPTRAHATPFLPSLEGLRAVACSGIIITHVAFQTGADTGSIINRMMARTDFFVPVFFALSGFLLWRRHSADFGLPALRAIMRSAVQAERVGATNTAKRANIALTEPPRAGDTNTANRMGTANSGLAHAVKELAWVWAGYYVKRIGRIMPACLATVAIVLLVFPVAGNPGWKEILANLTLTQIYVPHGLVGGLTHLWSLCVEMAFYLALPFLSLCVGGRSAGTRIAMIVGVSLISFGWAFIPAFAQAPQAGQINPHVMPPAFAAWFGVGMLAAELERIKIAAQQTHNTQRLEWLRRVFGTFRFAWWLLALGALFIAANDGPEGLTHAEPAEFARRTFYGLVFAAALLLPYVLGPASGWLESAWMQALGRWSYAIFLWHMSLLSVVFPLLGLNLFGGYTALVLVATFVLTVPVAALSYALVEEPARRAINKWWRSVRP